MPAYLYKIIHLTGVMMIFLSLGGLIVRSQWGDSDDALKLKRFSGMTNGIGLLLSLIGGFGLLAKLGYAFEGWVMAKMLIWLIFGGLIALINRKPEAGKALWFVIILLGAAAAYLAGMKPF